MRGGAELVIGPPTTTTTSALITVTHEHPRAASRYYPALEHIYPEGKFCARHWWRFPQRSAPPPPHQPPPHTPADCPRFLLPSPSAVCAAEQQVTAASAVTTACCCYLHSLGGRNRFLSRLGSVGEREATPNQGGELQAPPPLEAVGLD